MLNDRDQEMLNDLEHQLLLEDPVLVQEFRNVGKLAMTTRSASSAMATTGNPPQWYDLFVTTVLGVAALFVAFVALPGAPGAIIGVALVGGAVAWARYWMHPLRCRGPRSSH